MSFGSGGFGFGQNTQQSSTPAFGGFGSNTNTTPAFGQNPGGGFGATNTNPTGGGLFGNTGGFGGTGGAFGSSTNTAFGANKPAFGGTATSSGGSLFGSSTATAGPSAFGGFGTSTPSSSSAFGGGSSLFGGSKPSTGGFGATSIPATSTGSLFGGGGSAFGSTTTGAFGATTNPGLGTSVAEPSGTQVVPFQPTVEKEANNPTQQNSFQNILFMEPYKKYSADELRLADYSQGRRHGTATGGTGAFGVNSSFGSGGFGANTQQNTSFGSTGAGLFGSNTNQPAAGGFGQPSTSTGAFGGGTGGMFGQNKPAATSLFGNTATQPAQTGGSVFGGGFGGTTANTGGGFGSATNTGGGLFGANANAPKPAGGFSFGGGTGTSGGFGSNTGATPSGFGGATTASTPAGIFGNPGQQQQTGALFGQGQPNPQGGFGGGGFGAQAQQGTPSLFGNTQQKPAGSLFGNTASGANTGGGLFGSGGANTTTSGFGGATNLQAGGGLFGNKPAAPTSSLFGGAPASQPGATGGGLFGGLGASTQIQQQQPAQGSLFGGLGQTPQKSSLFGTTQGTGGALFGGQSQPQQGGLFGSTQQSQAPGGNLFSQMQSQSAPQSLTASLADMSAYGAGSLFAGVGSNDVQNPGPLATPLSSAKKSQPRANLLPIYKLTKPSTPKRGGFGFTHSTYGSPATPSSVSSTPGGFGQSLLAGSINRGLSKSISTSNLRRSFNVEDSILAPGAFSASTGPRNHGSTGSVKRLVINRDLRSDLFSTPSKDRQAQEFSSSSRRASKRVSFDTTSASALEQGNQDESDAATPPRSGAQDLGYLRPSSRTTNGVNGARSAPSVDAAPEMEQVKGNELAIVHEEESPTVTPRSTDGLRDKEAGDYWMRPTKEEIQNMNRVQRQKVVDFTIGRDNIGSVRFRVPVDLSNIDLDELFDGIVVLRPRSCTVYPNQAKKPAVGKGLNVPAEISLEQSWPRGRDKAISRLLNKHVERLKRIADTSFVSYNQETGVWVFTVEHFTTYGLDDDDDDDDDEGETDMEGTNVQAPVEAAPVPTLPQPQFESQSRPQNQVQGQGFESPDTDPDDTFNFRHGRRVVPGAFDPSEEAMDDEEEIPDHRGFVRPPSSNGSPDSPSRDRAADTLQDQADLEMTVEDEAEAEAEAGSPEISAAQDALDGSLHLSPVIAPPPSETPAGILRARMRALKESTAPTSFEVTGGDDWMDILKKSVNSGKQRNRAALRSLQESNMNRVDNKVAGQIGRGNKVAAGAARRVVSDGRGFATSIDLMNSLFGKDRVLSPDEGTPAAAAVAVQPAKSFIKWPYQKQHQPSVDTNQLDPRQRQFHNSFKPRWGHANSLLVAKPSQSGAQMRSFRTSKSKNVSSDITQISTGIATGSREIWSVKLSPRSAGSHAGTIANEEYGPSRHRSWISTRFGPGKVPEVVRPDQLPSFRDILTDVGRETPSVAYEKLVWELASILFDSVVGVADEGRLRRENLSKFWQKLVEEKTTSAVSDATRPEEKAFACLAGRRTIDACRHLIDSKLYKLATIVPLVGTSDQARKDMAEQMEEWQDGDVLSEIETPLRAIYSLLAGNVSVCKGKTAAGSENRLETFTLSNHFGLDWKQAFGLRLWYGILSSDDIAAAVVSFEQDVEQGLVPRPVPWYVGGDGDADKENTKGSQDMLWGLLKLYAGQASLEEVLEPESCCPSHTDYSLCWHLGQLLSASGGASFSRQGQQSKADALTVAFGSQLMEGMNWSQAVPVFLHLSDRGARAKAVQDVIARVAMEYAGPGRHGSIINNKSSGEPGGIKKLLELERLYHVPKTWMSEACALAYRYLGNRADCTHPGGFHLVMREVRCLALADPRAAQQELQSVVVRRLDPLAILQWPPSRALDSLVRYLRARPVNDGLGELALLASGGGGAAGDKARRQQGHGAPASFDFDRYLGMLRKRYEDADEGDVVMLAAISTLTEWVEGVRLRG